MSFIQLPFVAVDSSDPKSAIQQIAQVSSDSSGIIQTELNMKERRIIALEAQVAALGKWKSPQFSAGDFSGSLSMTWTVPSTSVLAYEYMNIGNTYFISFLLSASTTVGGVVSAALTILLPEGKKAAKTTTVGLLSYSDNGGTFADGSIATTAADTHLLLHKVDYSAWTLSAAATGVTGLAIVDTLP